LIIYGALKCRKQISLIVGAAMRVIKNLMICVVMTQSLVLATSGFAQSAADQQAQQPIPASRNFIGLGIGAFPKTAGSTDLRVMALPVLQYTFGDVGYITGLKAGLWGYTSDDRSLRIGLYAEPRFGYDSSDNPVTAGTPDRRFAIDAGPSVRWTTPVGVLNFDYGFDVTNRSNGQVAQLQFIRPLVSETGFRLNGLIGATWQNAAMNDYYWSVGSYKAGAGTGLSVGLTGLYSFGPTSALFYGATINRLSSTQANSPMTERSFAPLIYLGYGWRM
jgi:outer membrane protein